MFRFKTSWVAVLELFLRGGPIMSSLSMEAILTVKLNLGLGGEPHEDYVNIDKNPCAPKVNVVHDLDQYPWPFESEIADEIIMEHCLEHLVDNNRTMKDIRHIPETIFSRFSNVYEQSPLRIFPALTVDAELIK
jgi:hypothetical protein